MRTTSKLATGGGIMFAGLMASYFFRFIYRASIGRFLNPEAYGLLMAGIAVLSIAETLSLVAMDTGIVKFVSGNSGDRQWFSDVLASALLLVLPLSIALSATMYLGAGFIASELLNSPGATDLIEIFAIALPFSNLTSLLVAGIRARKKIRYVVYTRHIFQNLVKLSTAGLAIGLGLGITGVVWGWLLSSVASTALISYYIYSKLLKIRKPGKLIPEQLLDYSWPLFLTGVLGLLMAWTDTLMLIYLKGSAEVGIYNAAAPIAGLIGIFRSATGSINLPIMNELYSKGRLEELKGFYRTNTRWTVTFAAPIFLLLLIFADQVIRLTFGPGFLSGGFKLIGIQLIPASAALRILALGSFMNILVGPSGQILKTTDRTKLSLLNTLFSVTGNIALNILLIPPLGVIGAAIASLISAAIGNMLAFIQLYLLERINSIHRGLAPSFLAGAISVLATYLSLQLFQPATPIGTFGTGTLSIVPVYTVSLVLLGGIREEDKEVIREIGRKTGRERLAEKLVNLVSR